MVSLCTRLVGNMSLVLRHLVTPSEAPAFPLLRAPHLARHRPLQKRPCELAFYFLSVSSLGPRKRSATTRQLKTTAVTLPEARSPKSGCGQGPAPSESCRGPIHGSPWLPVVCRRALAFLPARRRVTRSLPSSSPGLSLCLSTSPSFAVCLSLCPHFPSA